MDLAAAVDPDLSFFCGRRRRKRHLAAPENDDAGDAGVGLGDEGDAAWHTQLEIFRAQREVHDPVLLFRIDGQPIQAAHRRQDVQPRDAPLGRVGRFAEYSDEQRADPRISAELGQHVDVDVVREPFRDPGDFGAQPLLHDSTRDAGLQPFVVELGAGVCARRDSAA